MVECSRAPLTANVNIAPSLFLLLGDLVTAAASVAPRQWKHGVCRATVVTDVMLDPSINVSVANVAGPFAFTSNQ